MVARMREVVVDLRPIVLAAPIAPVVIPTILAIARPIDAVLIMLGDNRPTLYFPGLGMPCAIERQDLHNRIKGRLIPPDRRWRAGDIGRAAAEAPARWREQTTVERPEAKSKNPDRRPLQIRERAIIADARTGWLGQVQITPSLHQRLRWIEQRQRPCPTDAAAGKTQTLLDTGFIGAIDVAGGIALRRVEKAISAVIDIACRPVRISPQLVNQIDELLENGQRRVQQQ